MGLAQSGFVGQGNTAMLLIDPTGSGSSTTYGWTAAAGTGAGSSRGHFMGHDGKVYRSAWTLNGIVVNDWETTTPTVTNLVNDTTNYIMGAPYQPVLDFNSSGGPGIVCVDGNPAPAPAPTGHRNWFSVDINAPSFATDGYFLNSNVPMSDCYRNPHNSKQIVTVGFATSDQKIDTWELPGAGSLFTANTVLTLTNTCGYDACLHEDQKLYCWTSVAAGPIGFQVVDIKAKTQSFTAVTGMTHLGSGYACVWNDPYEKAGRIAYVLQDSSSATVPELLYKVDLATGAATLIPLALPAGNYNTGRSIEDGQLTSWKVKNSATARNYHVNFGTVSVGDVYFLFPTVAGYSSTALVVDGQEIWLTPDFATVMAASNQLAAQTVGVFTSTSGVVDVTVNLFSTLNIDVVWCAARLKQGKVVDVSNYIIVGM